MKILIVGGNSSLGKSLIPVLSTVGEVITAGRKGCDLFLDLSGPLEKFVMPKGVEVVVLVAAHFGGTSDREIFDAVNTNVLGTLKLCQTAVKHNVKHFVLISSIFTESRKSFNLFNIYTLSKKHSEEIAKLYCSLNLLPLTIIRPARIYGNEETFRKHQPFFYSIIDMAQRGEDINIYGSNDAVRNYIHVDDLSAIVSEVISKKVYGSYSCVYPTNITYSQIAKSAIVNFHKNGKVKFLKNKPNIPDDIFKINNLLYKKIGHHPQISIDYGIKKIVAYRKNMQI